MQNFGFQPLKFGKFDRIGNIPHILMKNIDTDLVWKQKYFNSLDELEAKEKQWIEVEGLLRNVAVKMSLALDGIDNAFDQKLNELRRVFRAEPDKPELENIIYTITDSLDDIDQVKQAREQDENQARNILVSIVGSLPLPVELSNAAKVLQKEIQTADTQGQMYPVFGQLQVLLQATIDHCQKRADKSNNKSGLLSRFIKFSVNTKNDTNENSSTKTIALDADLVSTTDSGGDALISQPGEQASLQSGIDVLRLITQKLCLSNDTSSHLKFNPEKLGAIDNGQTLLEVAAQLSTTINRLWPRSSESLPLKSDRPDLNEALVSLLDKMSLPEKLNAEISVLQMRLQEDVKDEEWPEVLEKIANLVTCLRETVQKEKNEFEKYLANLTRRLQDIDNALRGVDSGRKLAHAQCLQLDKAMSKEVADIRQQIQNKSEIDPLKQVIEDRLQAIIVHMQQFRRVEDSRNQESEQTISELTQRLLVMESESKELKRKVAKQRKLAMFDRLTGIPNRLAYDQRLAQEYRRWRRFHENLCLMIIDIDYFKNINDSYGHKAGDRVLSKIAGLIKGRIRETDYLARYGGEEFTVLITGAGIQDALRVANNIRKTIADCGFHFRQKSVQVTVSAGLAQFIDNDTPEDVFERADKALYKAKNSGRNRCCM